MPFRCFPKLQIFITDNLAEQGGWLCIQMPFRCFPKLQILQQLIKSRLDFKLIVARDLGLQESSERFVFKYFDYFSSSFFQNNIKGSKYFSKHYDVVVPPFRDVKIIKFSK